MQQLYDLERVKPQHPPSLLLGLELVQSSLGVARVMSEQKVPRSVEQRIVIKFLVGENVPSAEIHHRLQQQYGEECLLRRLHKQTVVIYTFLDITVHLLVTGKIRKCTLGVTSLMNI